MTIEGANNMHAHYPMLFFRILRASDERQLEDGCACYGKPEDAGLIPGTTAFVGHGYDLALAYVANRALHHVSTKNARATIIETNAWEIEPLREWLDGRLAYNCTVREFTN